MQLFGLRKTPDLSHAPRQALTAFEHERAQIQRRAVGSNRPFAHSARFCGHKSTEQFESELKQRVEEICAQLRAGAYRAPPVRRVEIPKGPGKTGTRPLGIPTVADRLYKPNVIAASAAQRVDQTKSDPAAGVEELPALVSGWLHDLAS
jgi:hypothetical protein